MLHIIHRVFLWGLSPHIARATEKAGTLSASITKRAFSEQQVETHLRQCCITIVVHIRSAPGRPTRRITAAMCCCHARESLFSHSWILRQRTKMLSMQARQSQSELTQKRLARDATGNRNTEGDIVNTTMWKDLALPCQWIAATTWERRRKHDRHCPCMKWNCRGTFNQSLERERERERERDALLHRSSYAAYFFVAWPTLYKSHQLKRNSMSRQRRLSSNAWGDLRTLFRMWFSPCSALQSVVRMLRPTLSLHSYTTSPQCSSQRNRASRTCLGRKAFSLQPP